MKKRIVLCADDYGQAPAISQGILALLAMQRLSAVSCLVTTPHWAEAAIPLRPYYEQADLGLHFNLTEGKASLGSLMINACLRRLDVKALQQELHAQLDTFEAALGVPPRFIDGHQHVHQFPVVREALLAVWRERLQGKVYIRLSRDQGWGFKKWLVRAMGAKAWQRELERHKIPYNQTFSGMYAFKSTTPYATLFAEFVQAVGEGGLIMCHPGQWAGEASDPIALARKREFDYFASAAFLADCERYSVVIARFK